jgi:hypothetical protein
VSRLSILLDEGWTIPEVSERLGHADPAITAALYSRRMRDRRRELTFLDATLAPETAAEMGNGWATQGPETPANARQTDRAKWPVSAGSLEQRSRPEALPLARNEGPPGRVRASTYRRPQSDPRLRP